MTQISFTWAVFANITLWLINRFERFLHVNKINHIILAKNDQNAFALKLFAKIVFEFRINSFALKMENDPKWKNNLNILNSIVISFTYMILQKINCL